MGSVDSCGEGAVLGGKNPDDSVASVESNQEDLSSMINAYLHHDAAPTVPGLENGHDSTDHFKMLNSSVPCSDFVSNSPPMFNASSTDPLLDATTNGATVPLQHLLQ